MKKIKNLIEIKSKRKLREKHYLKEDGTFIAEVYNQDVHYLKNGKYEEIDNTLIKQNNQFINKNNVFHTYFNDVNINEEIMKIEKDGYYLSMYLKEGRNVKSKKTKKYRLEYNNILDDADLKYELLSNKVKESIILKNKNKIPSKIAFIIKTNLELKLTEDKTVEANKDNEAVFEIEAPYMFDSNDVINDDIHYELIKENDIYKLNLILDKEWLERDDILYPVIVDPTISTATGGTNLYDTYIYPGDTGIDRNSQDILKIGVEEINDVKVTYRTLLKFDLPTIGTGSEVIDAYVNLVSHSSYYISDDGIELILVEACRITQDWNEATADWNTMNDKFVYKAEDCKTIEPSTISDSEVILNNTEINLTNLIRDWYAGTPNYGVMLKKYREEIPFSDTLVVGCYSKNHDLSSIDPSPVLVIVYRNQNGLESYMSYQSQTFNDGISYINNFNGNLTTIFDLSKTINGKFPVNLNIAYNTNDAVLNEDFGYGKACKFNLHQTIKEVEIEEELLEYVDEDGTIHYFIKNEESNIYYDEDGLSLTAIKENDNYIIKDKNGNQYLFVSINDIWYLNEIKDTSENIITINYDISNRINSIVDANDQTINLTYDTNQIIITSPSETSYINYNNNQITSIITKNGTTSFTYNNYNLIETIIDINGKSIKYEYYDTLPYKIKKVSEYSILNNLGKTLDFNYKSFFTIVIDEKERYKIYSFNENGNTISVSNLTNENEIKNAYAKINEFGEETAKNKLIKNNSYIKYINNYLKNTTFENEDLYWISSPNITMAISEEYSNTESHSLKLISNSVNQNIYQEMEISKGKYYTFSAYIKNNNNLRIILSYVDSNNQLTESSSPLIKENDGFNRYYTTIYYPENSTSDLKIEISLDTVGIVFIDDIQLEEGEISNYYNLMENSGFTYDLEEWDISSSILEGWGVNELPNGNKFLSIGGNAEAVNILFKDINVSGKMNDTYNISFWYKNPGRKSSMVSLFFRNLSGLLSNIFTENLNPNINAWQHFSKNFVVGASYTSLRLNIFLAEEVSYVNVTNFSLFKDINGENYDYDSNSNLTRISDKTKEISEFKYDNNNQLINMLNPKGANFNFEYDNNVKDRVLSGISPTGISNRIKYDNFGNPIITNINNVRKDSKVTNKDYYIRQKGNDEYLTVSHNSIRLEEDTCSHNVWQVIKQDDYYKIKQLLSDRFLTLKDNTIMLTKYSNDLILFELTKNENGSCLIKPLNSENYLTVNENNILVLSALTEDKVNQEFYFEEADNSLFIENKAEYTEDGRFITKTTDTLGNSTTYDINTTNGLTNSVTDSKEITTYYTYNDKNQITSVTKEDKSVAYEYNDQNLLDTIIQGNKEYKFEYDEFLNVESINIGDNINLITNIYEENNGNLISSTYGNNDTVEFAYDEFDRIETITKMNDIYNYKYDNFGNLAKVISNEDMYKYDYDFAQRISIYIFNDFKINYDYDQNSSVINKKYKLDNTLNNTNYTYDNDNSVTKTEIDNNEINYIYDELGRLENKNINKEYNTAYKYITNGKKTSLILKSIKNDNEELSYKYDSLNNITHIFKNNILTNKYYYDNHSQLIKEDNYILN